MLNSFGIRSSRKQDSRGPGEVGRAPALCRVAGKEVFHLLLLEVFVKKEVLLLLGMEGSEY